jgi:hypothetical protein
MRRDIRSQKHPQAGTVHRFLLALLLAVHLARLPAVAQTLSLPPRLPTAPTGSQLATNATLLAADLITRETFLAQEILRGNVPGFLRQLCPVTISAPGATGTNTATLYVTPDYLAVGSDDDYLLVPLTPATAQHVADATDCTLPTRKIVAAIHARAPLQLSPEPLIPDQRMTSFPVFVVHNKLIRSQRTATLREQPLGTLVAGHKKDIVLTPRLATATNKVAIYGWHQPNGKAIQPLYLGHTSAWVDYSHGARLVSQSAMLNGRRTNLTAILADPKLCALLSDEGVITQPRYPTNEVPPVAVADLRWPLSFTISQAFGELVGEFNLPAGVRLIINTPPFHAFATNRPVQLICFALPNGNTIEQTIGKAMQPGDDWHFDLQHIGAQTRFLRSVLTNQTIVVAYLENSLKSWPAWRRAHGHEAIPALFDTIRTIFTAYPQEMVLTGHSGGGSLTFGYLNALDKIPADIKRIAFLDSNYAYETTNHFAKLTAWLKAADENQLCVLAYHDSIALLVSATTRARS